MVSFSGLGLESIEPNRTFEVIPAGDYPAIITEFDEVDTKDGTGKRCNLKLQIIDGKFQNRTLFDSLNTTNKVAIAQQIGRQQLKSICVALNHPNPQNSSELLNKALMITIKVGKDQNGNPRSEVKGYKARLTTAARVAEVVAQPPAAGSKVNPFA